MLILKAVSLQSSVISFQQTMTNYYLLISGGWHLSFLVAPGRTWPLSQRPCHPHGPIWAVIFP
jgi:hypothetical protein